MMLSEQSDGSEGRKTMRIFIVLGILLLPCLLYASTNCKVVEYGDHYDVSCSGDEKSAPASTQPAITNTPVETAPVAAQQGESAPSGVTADSSPAMQAHSAAQTGASQPPVVQRQGRRPPKSVMDEARAMRDQVIQERLQQQSTQ
jgi:hypothetical protein